MTQKKRKRSRITVHPTSWPKVTAGEHTILVEIGEWKDGTCRSVVEWHDVPSKWREDVRRAGAILEEAGVNYVEIDRESVGGL